ncbi:dihydrodipicolinate synthase family protein [Salibacterium sp. K-3]
MAAQELGQEKKKALHEGIVIPAHPLALNASYQLDEARQRALTRYYIAAGAGGVAVGVHSTQFEIRDPGVNLFEPVLRMAAEEVDKAEVSSPILKVAGICGPTEQAEQEARLAVELGYDIGLLSMGGLVDYSERDLLKRTEQVAAIMPVFGFYLQPAAGGRYFSYSFWEKFAGIPNVMAIKIAPFNRYKTIDVVRAVCHSPRRDDIALYTGNDDNIVADLFTTWQFHVDGELVTKRMAGGLLGHWSCWTKKAVEYFHEIKRAVKEKEEAIPAGLIQRNIEVTEANAAFFDAANQFKGCIPGIHEVLRRQGLLEGTWCLNPEHTLSPGQSEEIDRIYHDYPHLHDDDFVQENLAKWLG